MNTTRTDKNGFTVSKECSSIKEFLDINMDTLDECVHIVPNSDGTLKFYRLTDERVTNNYTENVRISLELKANSISYRNCEETPENLCFHNSKAKTVLSFLDCLKNERSGYKFVFRYYSKNNSKMLERHDVNMETLFLTYETNTGRYNEIEVSKPYDNRLGKFANY